jgi:hypothetical protein
MRTCERKLEARLETSRRAFERLNSDSPVRASEVIGLRDRAFSAVENSRVPVLYRRCSVQFHETL